MVTLPSEQSVVQLAAGFLRYLNATDGIVTSVDEYVNFAVEVATKPDVREQIRMQLLASHGAIYKDESAVHDWNAFLATVAGSTRSAAPVRDEL